MEKNDKKFAIVFTDFSFKTENENMIDQYKSTPNVLTVLPYDFYWNLEKDEATQKHNEKMLDKVNGWIDGYKFCQSRTKQVNPTPIK
jgi:hypothetical protein